MKYIKLPVKTIPTEVVEKYGNITENIPETYLNDTDLYIIPGIGMALGIEGTTLLELEIESSMFGSTLSLHMNIEDFVKELNLADKR